MDTDEGPEDCVLHEGQDNGPDYCDGTDAEGFPGGDRRMGLDRRVDQVGGDHYQAEYQHWDWVEDIGMGYLEAVATKYLTRWHKKDGLKDLKKAQSYLAKLLIFAELGRVNRVVNYNYPLFQRFCRCNGLVGPERDACLLIWKWSSGEDLRVALQIIKEIIDLNFPDVNQSKMGEGHPLASFV